MRPERLSVAGERLWAHAHRSSAPEAQLAPNLPATTHHPHHSELVTESTRRSYSSYWLQKIILWILRENLGDHLYKYSFTSVLIAEDGMCGHHRTQSDFQWMYEPYTRV